MYGLTLEVDVWSFVDYALFIIQIASFPSYLSPCAIITCSKCPQGNCVREPGLWNGPVGAEV